MSLRLIGAPATAPIGLTLIDTSAYAQIKHHSQAAERFTSLASRGLLATCNIAEVTGQPTEWIVPRGSGHGGLRNG